MYYLQSRYYDPVVGRFINTDTYASTGQSVIGHNMFAYCCNNPITLADRSGSVGTLAIVCAVSATISGVANAVATAVSGGSFQDCLLAGLVGAIGGGIGAFVGSTAPLSALAANVIGRGVATIITDLGTSLVLNGEITANDLAWTAVDTTMDMTLSPITYFYNPIEEIVEQTVVNVFIDGVTDVSQTMLFTGENTTEVKNEVKKPKVKKISRDYAHEKVGRLINLIA